VLDSSDLLEKGAGRNEKGINRSLATAAAYASVEDDGIKSRRKKNGSRCVLPRKPQTSNGAPTGPLLLCCAAAAAFAPLVAAWQATFFRLDDLCFLENKYLDDEQEGDVESVNYAII
jgi:hypothetical protein